MKAGRDWSITGPIRKASPVFVNTRAVNLYDNQGFLIRNDRFTAHRTATGDDCRSQSHEARTAKTYRVWLVK